MKFTEKYNEFITDFNNLIDKQNYKDLIFVCIGTDRITGDCFGPIVGSILINKQYTYKIPNIAIIGCFRGFQVENNTTSIGKYTTISVVNAIFVVILLDAVFSVIFTQMGI